MKSVITAALVGVACLFGAVQAKAAAAGPPPYGLSLDGDQAMAALTAAEAEARKNNWSLAISVVDTSGSLLAFHRMTGIAPLTGEISTLKAKSSAATRLTTKQLAAANANGPPLFLQLNLTPVEGAVPIVVGGKVVGAIGCSGALSSEDAQAAAAGAAAVR